MKRIDRALFSGDPPQLLAAMEREDKSFADLATDKLGFGRDETIETVDNSSASTAQLMLDEGMTAFLRALIRTKVLTAAIERLETRNISEQILDRRVRTLAGIAAHYATGNHFDRLTEDDSGNPLTEDVLLRQLLDLTGTLRGGFAALEAAAGILGRDWESDTRDFIDVTIGMSRLQLLMRKLVARSMTGRGQNVSGNALIAVAPGEVHTFGQCMLEEILRAHGWSTKLFNPAQTGGFLEQVRTNQAHLVCFSWVSPSLQSLVDADLAALKTTPLHMRPIIIAGGYAALEKEKWMVSHGVDHICDTAYSAMQIATQITDAIQQNAPKPIHDVPAVDAIAGRG